MKLYNYVHTGHRIGLDRFRRSATIISTLQKELPDLDILMLCSDFRIAQIAREYGVKRAVGIDVVRNIPQIANNGDKMIFDSAELNSYIHQDMLLYFSKFVRISDNPEDSKAQGEFLISPYLEGDDICNSYIVDEKYFQTYEKKYDISLFFGDDDYEEDLLQNIDMFKELDANLLLGYYFFLDYEAKLSPSFSACYESEDMYDAIITQSKLLITASPQAALESLASGGRVIYIQRADYPRDFLPLFEKLHIPIVDGYNSEQLNTLVAENSSHTYHNLVNNSKKVTEFLKKSLDL